MTKTVFLPLTAQIRRNGQLTRDLHQVAWVEFSIGTEFDQGRVALLRLTANWVGRQLGLPSLPGMAILTKGPLCDVDDPWGLTELHIAPTVAVGSLGILEALRLLPPIELQHLPRFEAARTTLRHILDQCGAKGVDTLDFPRFEVSSYGAIFLADVRPSFVGPRESLLTLAGHSSSLRVADCPIPLEDRTGSPPRLNVFWPETHGQGNMITAARAIELLKAELDLRSDLE